MTHSYLSQRLIDAATQVRESAWAPYSGFKVGAAVLDEHGRVHAACNVENASYPLGLCAEAGALAAMVAAGGRHVLRVAVVGHGRNGAWVTPCGACRQRLAEFARDDVPVHMAGAAGLQGTLTLKELLPHSFGAQHLNPDES